MLHQYHLSFPTLNLHMHMQLRTVCRELFLQLVPMEFMDSFPWEHGHHVQQVRTELSGVHPSASKRWIVPPNGRLMCENVIPSPPPDERPVALGLVGGVIFFAPCRPATRYSVVP